MQGNGSPKLYEKKKNIRNECNAVSISKPGLLHMFLCVLVPPNVVCVAFLASAHLHKGTESISIGTSIGWILLPAMIG
jgi:hypothetical protein